MVVASAIRNIKKMLGRKMLKSHLLKAFTAAALIATTAQAASVTIVLNGKTPAQVSAEIDGGQLPGAVIAVARRGRLVYYESFGYLDRVNGVAMPKRSSAGPAPLRRPGRGRGFLHAPLVFVANPALAR